MSPSRRAFVVLAAAIFSYQFADGINRSIQNNFFVEALHLQPDQMGLLTTAREVPGFLTALVAAGAMFLAPPHLGSAALAVMGVGYGSYGLVYSFGGLVAVAMVGSLGFHTWQPISNALGLSLATRDNAGQVLGRLQAFGFAAYLTSMAAVIAIVQVEQSAAGPAVRPELEPVYRMLFFASGSAMVVGALVVLAFPLGLAERPKERLVFRRRYFLYYLLTFLDGCRGQVFLAFGVYLLVRQYQVDVQTITGLLLMSSVISMALSAPVGGLIDRFGERRTLTFSYCGHFLTFVGLALVSSAAAAIALYVVYNVLLLSSMATNTYLKRTADPGDVAPSLAMGMSTMHLSAMIVPILGGLLWERFGYQIPFLVGAGFVVLSIVASQRIPARRPALGEPVGARTP